MQPVESAPANAQDLDEQAQKLTTSVGLFKLQEIPAAG
jgi:hypothetical protein